MTAAGGAHVALVSAGELYGGVERFIATFTDHLRRSGDAAATVFLFQEGELARELRAAGVAVEVSPYASKFDPRQIGWLAGRLRARGATVVHAHGYKAGVIAGLAASRAALPAVKTEHGAMEPFTGLARLKMKIYLALDRWLTEHRFEEVVYITSDLFRHRLWAGRRGARVIPNGIAAPSENGAAEKFDGDKFNVGIVGRLSPVKGHRVLLAALAAAARKDRLRLHVVGDGELRAELEATAKANGLDVIFHGFVRNAMDMMARFDAVAMPSFNEGLPYTLLEAMHLGLPIAASRVGGMAEILDDGASALLVAPGDAAAWAQALDRLASDEALRRRIGDGARAAARERFGIAPMARSYLNLYREVCRT